VQGEDVETAAVKVKASHPHRHHAIYAHLANFLNGYRRSGLPRTLVAVEGYTFGMAKGNRSAPYSAGEARCIAHLVTARLEGRMLIVSPTVLKVFVTGSSEASKQDMVEAMNEVTGLGFKKSQHDRVDALGLCCLGREISALRHPMSHVMLYDRRRALDNLELPW
jgi:Holliday junction resolvasome RuvABC endonuclease subunit